MLCNRRDELISCRKCAALRFENRQDRRELVDQARREEHQAGMKEVRIFILGISLTLAKPGKAEADREHQYRDGSDTGDETARTRLYHRGVALLRGGCLWQRWGFRPGRSSSIRLLLTTVGERPIPGLAERATAQQHRYDDGRGDEYGQHIGVNLSRSREPSSRRGNVNPSIS